MESNKVEFIGNVFKADVRTFDSGSMKTTITICKKNKDETFDYYDFTFWKEAAELASNFQKGDTVHIVGRLSKNKYTDKEGKNVNVLQVIANSIEKVKWDNDKKEYVSENPFAD